MHTTFVCARSCAVFATFFLLSPVLADVYVPTSASGSQIQGVDGTIFGWNRQDANSTYSGWDFFEGTQNPATVGLGFSDSSPDKINPFGTPSTIAVGTGAIPTASGNIYSPFATLSFLGTAASGTLGSGGSEFTRLVAQIRTSGTGLDESSILLTVGGSAVAPGLLLSSDGLPAPPAAPAGTPPGTDYLALWDINGSQAGYDFAFTGAGSSLSLEEFEVDTFVRNSAFVTPSISAVPEPSSLAVLTILGGFAIGQRRRRKPVSTSASS